MDIVLHSTGCPRCKVLETKLNARGIKYTINNDTEKMEALGIMSVPCLEVDGKIMQFKEANDWINKGGGSN